MTKSGRKKSLSFSPFRLVRRRQQAAKDKRFCMIWIKKMVNKQVEKHIADMRSELLLLHYTMREEMAEEFQEQLRDLALEEEEERALLYARVKQEQRVTSRWRQKMKKDYKEKREKDETETPSDSDSTYIMRKNDLEENLRILLDVSSGDTPDVDTSDDVSCDADISSQTEKCEQGENQQISSDVAVATTSQLIKESLEKEKSSNPFHPYPSFLTKELRHKEERVHVVRTKEEEAVLMDRQWKEWLDNQEMRENHKEVKPVEQQTTEKQEEAAPPAVPQKQVKQNVTEVDTMTKVKTYIFDLFNAHTAYTWKRFEDED